MAPAHPSGGERSHLEEFVALVAHEVRTPLTIVKGAVETLRRADDRLSTEERAELTAMIARNVDLASLLMDRLSLARDVEQGEVVLVKERLDLGLLVRQSVGDLNFAVLADHPVTVSAGEVTVDADPTAAREIVFNLLSNAAKYSAEDAPIDVIVERVQDIARLVVRNHGRGVAPGDTDRIFDKYFQVDDASTGVGLGLFISRGLARAHGGDLQIRPAEKSGSEFWLELPV
jgi:signal transduction histidine kinase